ncbi:protein bicaudal C homolog 1-like isoform X2 [Babylonia areolata]
MSILDTKSNRVTLKMDVSHTDHSHVIGKGGNNIKRVMMETACHIHFPDSNRGSNVQEKSNQVSIAGQPSGVEHARMQIRELLPLVFLIELPTSTALIQTLPDSSSPLIQHLQQTYNVTITFRQRPRMPVTTAIVRGSVINAKAVKEATGKLVEALTGNVNSGVSMHLEIAPQHHRFIIGQQGFNLNRIMQSTNARILFPDPASSSPQRKGTVVITGNIESVYCARENLIGCLPLVLMFDVKDDIELDQEKLTKLTDQLDVFISVKPKPRQPSKSVIVKSVERNSQNMYLARRLLLGLHPEGHSESLLKTANTTATTTATNPHSSAGLGLTSLGLYNTQALLNANQSGSVLMMNGRHPACLGSPLPAHSPNVAQWLQGAPAAGVYGPLMVVTPAHSHSVQASYDIVSHRTGFQSIDTSAFIRVPTPQNQGSSGNSSGCASPATESSSGSPQSLVGFRHRSVLQSEDSLENLITRDPSTLSSSGHTLDLLGLSKTTPVSQTLPVTATLFNTRMENGERSPDSSGTESDGSEKLGVGTGHNSTSSSLFPSPLPYPFDYEQKKLLALKAMQKNPNGESRIPTDRWSGFGFSKSMPESAIRDRLGQLGISQSRMDDQGTVPSPSELADDCTQDVELEDIDRDPWKDSKTRTSPYLNRAPGEYPCLRRKYDYGSTQHRQEAQHPPSSQSSRPDGGQKVDLAELFSKMGLGKYTDVFQQQEIDFSTFLTLNEEDLKELGIGTFGARRKMMLVIADLNKSQLQSAQSHNNPFHMNGAVSSSRCPDIASISGRW